MERRRFLRSALAAPAGALLAGCSRLSRLGVAVTVLRPGMAEGHGLRDGSTQIGAGAQRRCEVVIVGSGIAGLTAAWRLAKAGFQDFVLLEGPEPYGNAAGGRFASPAGEIPFPRGAHYLPLPSAESTPVRELLFELGIIEADPFGPRPRYAETALVHAPDERLWFNGAWHEGLLPTQAVGAEEAAQHRRFLAYVNGLTMRRGRDGRYLFRVPLVQSSRDPDWLRLDRVTFDAWLRAAGNTSPTLFAWLDYVCRDEYGAGSGEVSAWAGLHYFASRGGHSANAADGAVLTWPDGLAGLARGLGQRLTPMQRLSGHALGIVPDKNGVTIHCITPTGPLTLHAARCICATPLQVAARLVRNIDDFGFEPARHLPQQAAWLVANFLLAGFPRERGELPLAWDNVIHASPGLGWVVATHQWIRVGAPTHTVFTAYRALADRSPQQARQLLQHADVDSLLDLASVDLAQIYRDPLEWWRRLQAVEITVRGHAMATPTPGSLSNEGLAALRAADGRLLFAHSDLSAYSVFEEAAWWGDQAARKILA